MAYLNDKTGVYLCKWHPMNVGLRKGLARNDILVQSMIVCENDIHWRWVEGYSPRIEHEPAKLGTDKGKWLGTYAIFRQGNEVLHQEVMDWRQIEAVQGVSKMGAGLMWGRFPDQAWIKTVVRRGIKSVPILTPDVEDIVKNDDRYTDWGSVETALTEPQEQKQKDGKSYNPLQDPTHAEIVAAQNARARGDAEDVEGDDSAQASEREVSGE
jgi:recombinational DNA repair protein RecT